MPILDRLVDEQKSQVKMLFCTLFPMSTNYVLLYSVYHTYKALNYLMMTANAKLKGKIVTT